MEQKLFIEAPSFTGRNVPIDEISKVTGKSPTFLREMLKRGIMHFGYALKNEETSSFSYFCPDKLVWEETGYFNSNPGGGK